ncbi:UDP-N-acetylglucosamine 2-epimerase [Lentilitoribacter sp. EG35]|uniref:UDP-N-acetylglucosamine 2-epimerase n=1 Tax=Lentilitoribacter sp. EG35 TaxID=3234192 RepID=UPI003460056E
MRTVCVVTGTRADYGLLRWVMSGIKKSSDLQLQLIATGSHLSPEYGSTYKDIENDGFIIDKKIDILLSSDSAASITKSIGLATFGFADALSLLQPDLLLLLGDRYEIFAAATAAMIAGIPIAHLHGGEATEAAYDEAFRHSITKMSNLHFVAAEPYLRRVLQLGEHPESVFQVGGLGIDSIKRLKLLSRVELEQSLSFKLGIKNLLVTFHPSTLNLGSAEKQTEELLAALDALHDTHIIFTSPNADTENHKIKDMLQKFVSKRSTAKLFNSLGQCRYFSAIEQCDAVVGNSSSGLIEVPSFYKGTVNIGDRQKGRIKADSVIDCEPERESIRSAIESAYGDNFQKKLVSVKNPYGNGGASDRIIEILEQRDFRENMKKTFQDINFF